MTVRSTLMLMAATLAPLPLHAWQAEPAPAQACAPAADTLAKRAAVLEPLAYIPADADLAVMLGDVRPLLDEIRQHIELPYELNSLESIAIGGAKGVGLNLSDLFTVSFLKSIHGGKSGLIDQWADASAPQYHGILEAARTLSRDQDYGKVAALAARYKNHPGYAVLSFRDVPSANAFYRIIQQAFTGQASRHECSELLHIGGWLALRHSFRNDKIPASSGGFDVINIVIKEMVHRTFYVMCHQQGRNVVLVLAEDPAEVKLPQTPQESIINTPAFDAVDAHLGDEILFIAYGSPCLVMAGYAGMQVLCDAVSPIAQTFIKMAGISPSPDEASAFSSAEAGIQAMTGQIQRLMPPLDKPVFCHVWGTPGAYHAELTCDACGFEFEPAKLALSKCADNPDTIFCVESTPLHSTRPLPEAGALTEAGKAVFRGVMASLPLETSGRVDEQLQQAMVLKPELDGVCCALTSIWDGLGGTTGMVVDGKCKVPSYLTDGAQVSGPRVAIYSGVVDRSKLSDGWDGLLSVAGDLMEKCNQDRDMLLMLPIVPSRVADAGATSYTVAIPGVLTPDFGANVTVGDGAFVVGSSSNLNKEVITSATGGCGFAGVTFTLHTKPLSDTARSIADAMLAAAGPIEMERIYYGEADAVCDVCGETAPSGYDIFHCTGDCEFCEEDESEDLYGDRVDDSDETIIGRVDYGMEDGRRYIEITHLKPGQEQAFSAGKLADALEGFARSVENVKGDISISDGKKTIRVDINLRNK